MSSHPKLSVITTLYNCERYVADSLRSVLEQTYSDFQWIVLNDGSTDSTWKIVNKMIGDDSRAVLVDNKENKRIPASRNEAIKLATGKYIAIHDGDDISLPHRFMSQVGFLDSRKDIFCVGGHAISIDHEGNQKGMMVYPPAHHRQIVFSLLRLKQNPVIDPTSMFRKADFEKLGGYTLNEDLYTVPDMDLWARAIVSGKVMANMQDALIRYRVNPNGMTQKHKSQMIDAHMMVWRRFRKEYNEAIGRGEKL